MLSKKTLQEREQELRSLLATPIGQEEIRQLTARYEAASDHPWREGTSAITYILVHERGLGLFGT
jgi:hypothetical protein